MRRPGAETARAWLRGRSPRPCGERTDRPLWLYRLERFPLKIVRKAAVAETDDDRRELLGLAQAVSTELETCRYRLSDAKRERRGWFSERSLPAEMYNMRWTPALVTADQVAINDALRGFYVWTDEINHRIDRRGWAEVNAIGSVLRDKSLDLDDDDLAEVDEGLNRIKNAQDLLTALIERLERK
jgi:hypothetical protein